MVAEASSAVDETKQLTIVESSSSSSSPVAATVTSRRPSERLALLVAMDREAALALERALQSFFAGDDGAFASGAGSPIPSTARVFLYRASGSASADEILARLRETRREEKEAHVLVLAPASVEQREMETRLASALGERRVASAELQPRHHNRELCKRVGAWLFSHARRRAGAFVQTCEREAAAAAAAQDAPPRHEHEPREQKSRVRRLTLTP